MRHDLVLVLLLLAAGCSSPDVTQAVGQPVAILVTDARTGLVAVSAVGARNVRVLLVRGPSIVRLCEVFVPDGEAVAAVRWAADRHALIVETGSTQFALDPASGRLAQLAPDAAGLATRSRSAPHG